METALLAVLTAILGAIAGGFLRERGDREALLRDRRIAAADDFLTTANEVFIALTAAMERNPFPDREHAEEWLAKIATVTREARANAHHVTRRVARIELLFGRGSPTSSAAVELVKQVLTLTDILNNRRPENMEALQETWDSGVDAMGAFTAQAHAIIAARRRWEHPFSQPRRQLQDS